MISSSTGLLFPLGGGGGHPPLISRPRFCFRRKLIFCQANQIDSALDALSHEDSGGTPVHVIENFQHLPDPGTSVPSTPQSGMSVSKSLRAVLKVSVPGPSGNLPPHVNYLLELGFDLEQIKLIASKYPAFANYSLEDNIRPLIELLLDLGVSESDLPKILIKHPPLCTSENLIPSLSYIDTLGVDKSKWPKLISRWPKFFSLSLEKVVGTVEYLYELGLTEEDIVKILTRRPMIVSISVEEKLRPTVGYFQSLGVDAARLIRRFPDIMGLSIETNLKPFTEFFLENGFSIEDVRTMVSRFAPLYACSLNGSVVPKWEFFLTTDYSRQELIKHPQYFGYSMENRIKLRYNLMKRSGVQLSIYKLLHTADDCFGELIEKEIEKLQLGESCSG